MTYRQEIDLGDGIQVFEADSLDKVVDQIANARKKNRPIPQPKPPTQALSPCPWPVPFHLADYIDDIRRLLRKLEAAGYDPISVLERSQIIPEGRLVLNPKADVDS